MSPPTTSVALLETHLHLSIEICYSLGRAVVALATSSTTAPSRAATSPGT